MSGFLERLEEIRAQALAAVESAKSLERLEELRVKYLGRKGELSLLLRSIKDLPAEQRPSAGEMGNRIRQQLEESMGKRLASLRTMEEGPRLDVSLPGRPFLRGRKHLITQTLEEILSIFVSMGYSVVTGPEVELDYYNFEALNIPKDHPARDMQDTFYISEQVLLRTHTSPMQVRIMEKGPPPVQIVCPGKVYRHDSDPTHSPMFHQVEGLLVDRGVTFADLKGTLTAFVQKMFGRSTALRFRPSFFPFTEPSAEVDIRCVLCAGKGCPLCGATGWLEILGSGLVDPAVYGFVGYDPEIYSGFAFGLGVERIAMLRHGVDDIRLFYENDVRFLEQF
ncbi:MAG: phenylalanine--tRNA ligase subunit alpha [Thermodesulfobacteriota bacterium]